MTEGPYKLPEGWRWVRLGEVCQTITGVWGKRDENGDSVLRSTNFTDEGHLTFDNVAKVLLTSQQRRKAVLAKNDILLERSGGGPNKPVGRVCIFVGGPEDRPYYFGNFITVLRVHREDIEPTFVFHYLRWFHVSGHTEHLQTQTTNIRNLRFKEYLQTLIPLPPLDEQRRIVARIEELMGRIREARRLREEARQDTERLWQSVLADTFPRPGSDLPAGWRWVRLGEVCEINPRRPRLSRSSDAPTSFVPMNAVDDATGTIVRAEVRPFAQVRKGYTYFQEGDVLFAKITPCMENGKSAVATGLIEGLGFGSTEFHVLRPRGIVAPEWVWLFVRREDFRKAAKAAFRGGVGQQRVPPEFLRETLIPLPPLEEQRRIVAHLEVVQEKIRALKAGQAETDEELRRLEQSILDKAFRGEL